MAKLKLYIMLIALLRQALKALDKKPNKVEFVIQSNEALKALNNAKSEEEYYQAVSNFRELSYGVLPKRN